VRVFTASELLVVDMIPFSLEEHRRNGGGKVDRRSGAG
jgi:hypothetical protein